jgi:hypothetical protein
MSTEQFEHDGFNAPNEAEMSAKTFASRMQESSDARQQAQQEAVDALKMLADRNFTYLDGFVMGGQISSADVQKARNALARIS